MAYGTRHTRRGTAPWGGDPLGTGSGHGLSFDRSLVSISMRLINDESYDNQDEVSNRGANRGSLLMSNIACTTLIPNLEEEDAINVDQELENVGSGNFREGALRRRRAQSCMITIPSIPYLRDMFIS